MANRNDYNADSIEALTPRQHLLKRLSLTFGREGTDPEYQFSLQKNVAIREILDNAVDEIRSGYGDKVRIHIFKDGSIEIQDNGRGVPVDVNTKTNQSGIYMALGILRSGSKFSTGNDYTSGLNGVGASSAISVSNRTDIIVFRNNKKYELSFSNGEAGFFKPDKKNDDSSVFQTLKELSRDESYLRITKDDRPANEKANYKTGTIVRIWLNPNIFASKKPFDDKDLIERAKYIAFQVPKIKIEITDEKWLVDGKKCFHETFYYPDGLKGLCDLIAPSNNRLTEIQTVEAEGHYVENAPVLNEKTGAVRIEEVHRTVPVQVAFVYTNSEDYKLLSFVNTIYTRLGGVHEKAFEQAMLKAFNDKIMSIRGKIMKNNTPPIIDDYRIGMVAVLSVQQSEPVFTSQNKEELSGDENQKAIKESLIEAFEKFIKSSKNKKAVDAICTKVAEESRIRQAEKAARDVKRKASSALKTSIMPAKLIDCKNIYDELSELHIVEGDSAASGLKASRDSRYEAILPIRGKIINALKSPLASVLNNEEIQGIITCLGTGIKEDCDVSKMRYGRVVISTDADVDGLAIICLLITDFYVLFKPIIEAGRLYVSYPPLFEICLNNNETLYALNRGQLAQIEETLSSKGLKVNKDYRINRDKGLGSMQPSDARATLMNPSTRVLRKIMLTDVHNAESMLTLALGKDTTMRKQWISDNFDQIDDDELDY